MAAADEVNVLGKEEVEALLNAASVRDRALLGLFVLGGLSVRQVHGLRREDVHLDTSPPWVQVRLGARGEKPRPITLEPALAEYLKEHLGVLPWAKGGAPLFFAGSNEPLTMRQMQRVCQSVGQDVGLGPITPRQLQLTCIEGWRAQAVPFEEMQRRLGETSLSFTYRLAPGQARHRRGQRPRTRPSPRRGRRPETEQHAELIELRWRGVAEGQKPHSYEEVKIKYNELHDKHQLTREAVRHAIRAYDPRYNR
jgi:integrase